jgi:multidrug efflux system membrane fusion protein
MKQENFLAAERLGQGSTASLRRRALLGGGALLLVSGLFLALHAGAGTAPPAANAPVPVTVETVQPRPVHVWSEFSGRMTAVDSADIRPEVNGRITEIRFKDGQEVKAGDILFVIDPRPYEAAVTKAEADLATAQTNARLAKTELDRAQKLMDAQAVSRDLYDQRANANAVAAAAVQSAQAALDQAKLDVDHAYVKAPISGRVGRAEITVGNLVQTTATPPVLTTIVSDDGIYADFDVDEQTYIRSVRARAQTASQEQTIPVELRVTGDEGHVYKGTIESFDNKIDTGTGTIRARARFANADGSLVPGMFVSVRLAGNPDAKALLVPEDAVGSDQSKRFVYVVGRDHHADYRAVTLGDSVDGNRIVTAGLHAGDRVIVDGLQKVQPGAVVNDYPPAGSQRSQYAER